MDATICGIEPVPVLLAWAGAFVLLSFWASFAWRKEGITIRELSEAGFSAVMHPERCYRANRVRAITIIDVLGMGGWMVGLVALAAGSLLCGP
jgi:hypothetical protein